MQKFKKKNGFTMAEMLVVVAIIAVLSAVTFIAVQRYQRSLARLERDSIAKEIFVAAQNHLTMLESQGYFRKEEKKAVDDEGPFGKSETAVEESGGIYYITVNQRNADPSASQNILDRVLPAGAADETVLSGGSYVIRYQANPGLVLDVFYCSCNDARFNHTITKDEYSSLMANYKGTDKTKNRENYEIDDSVVGWYGGEEAAELKNGKALNSPIIELVNKDKLYVKITDRNKDHEEGYSLKLVVTGLESNGNAVVDLMDIGLDDKHIIKSSSGGYDTYIVILDDITVDGIHFRTFANKDKYVADYGKRLAPGENIAVKAVASNTAKLTNVAESEEQEDNSLFANGTDLTTAKISNIRHLENLDDHVSDVAYNGALNAPNLKISYAEQLNDLSWEDEWEGEWEGSWKEDAVITDLEGNYEKEGCYRPISPAYSLKYEGNSLSISDIVVDTSENAGLFGSLQKDSSVSNLELIDFSIKSSSGNAGSLAGLLTDTTIDNVIYHSSSSEKDSKCSITASDSGKASGGLVGSMTGGAIKNSAAAVYVESTSGDAGGLVGTVNGSTITSCYSGGHTDDGQYPAAKAADGSEKKYDVTAGTNSGGLVGSTTGSTKISDSYSTCSVNGAVAGGFAGTVDTGASIDNCYATGWVEAAGTDGFEGAFAGKFSAGATAPDCRYFEIINERTGEDNSISYLLAVGDGTSASEITPLDQDVKSYDEFVEGPDEWGEAEPYDGDLADYYPPAASSSAPAAYPLRDLLRLSGKTSLSDSSDADAAPVCFAETHYGDWPAPEIFVINVPAS